jgi:hypothetical protein
MSRLGNMHRQRIQDLLAKHHVFCPSVSAISRNRRAVGGMGPTANNNRRQP